MCILAQLEHCAASQQDQLSGRRNGRAYAETIALDDYNAANITQDTDITGRLEGRTTQQDSQDGNDTSNEEEEEEEDDQEQETSMFSRRITPDPILRRARTQRETIIILIGRSADVTER
jgi:hypothetical protein